MTNAIAKPNNALSILKGLFKDRREEEDRSATFIKNLTIKAQHNTSKPRFDVPNKDTIHPLYATIVQNVRVNELRRDGDDSAMAECYSMGGTYGTRYGECATCKYNVWSDGQNGKKTKLCKQHFRLALVLTEDDDVRVYEMKVSPSSQKEYTEYKKKLADMDKREYEVVTKMTLSPTKNGSKTFSVIKFDYEKDIAECEEEFLNRLVLGNKKVEGEKFFKLTKPAVGAKKPEELTEEPKTEVTPGKAETSAVEDAEIVDEPKSKIVEMEGNSDPIPF